MPIQLLLEEKPLVAVNVTGIVPLKLARLSKKEIATLPIHVGNQSKPLESVFSISGSTTDEEPRLEFAGELGLVVGIGEGLDRGEISIVGNAGHNVGRSMSAGTISVTGNVGDFAGAEMTGGQLLVSGRAGNFTGANCPGAKYGMNGGTIVVGGEAGQSVGRRMRRGTIVVQGNVEDLLGWEMLAGTIIVFGRPGVQTGLEMKRGTIVLANDVKIKDHLSPMFEQGSTGRPQIFSLITQWLNKDVTVLAEDFLQQKLIDQNFVHFHGDTNEGGRGEIFVATDAQVFS